jgi:hypothetical protein
MYLFSGAMTMFFSSYKKVPFEHVEVGLEMYPKWKMIMFDGLGKTQHTIRIFF